VGARPKTKPWVTNALTREAVSPDLAWLINRLATLNPRGALDRADVISYHTHEIRGRWWSWRWPDGNYAIRITGDVRPRTKPIPVNAGVTKELERLLRAAQGRSDKQWSMVWLGVSGTTHRLIDWPPVPPVIRREVNSDGKLVRFERANLAVRHRWVSVRGVHAIMPTRADAVPLIKAALRKHKAIPIAERRKAKPDYLANDLAFAVCVAYRDLTGRRGDNTWSDQSDSGLFALCRDIHSRWGAKALTITRVRSVIASDRYRAAFKK
jgi:hypothetical protein